LRLLGAERLETAPAGSVEAHLIGRYGSLATEIEALVAADPDLGEPLVPGQPYLRAEAIHATRHEMALTLDDVLVRRTRAHLFDRAATVAAASGVADLMAGELGWDPAERQRQLDAYLALCAREEEAASDHLAHTTD
jgi:glycerol-3-phosphate dehydrogenase